MTNTIANRIAPIAALAMSTALAGCGGLDISLGGDGVPLSEFEAGSTAPTELALAAPASVIITQGDALDIQLEGDEDAANRMRFDQDGSTLKISHEEKSWNGNDSVTVRVTMPAPSSLVIGGSGSIETPSMSEDAEIMIGGAGSVKVASLAAESLEISIGGSGNVSAAGSADELEINIGGSGDVDLADLAVERAEITIGGSGDVVFMSDGEVEATFAGSGKVRVIGDANCKSSSFGSGELVCGPVD